MNKKELYELDAIEIYKMVLKRDQIKKFPDGFWQQPEAKQNAIKVTKYLIENILKWKDEDIKQKLNFKIFTKYKLHGMLRKLYNNSPYQLINNIYPNKFKPWQFSSVPRNYWNKENAKEATKWLIEDILKYSDEDIKNKLNVEIIRKYKLGGMLNHVYNNGVYNLINGIYPNKFKPWELNQSPKNYWNKENAKEAMKWLIEEKLQWSDKDIKEKLTKDIFKQNKLDGMLQTIYNSSPYKAINNLYPNKFKKYDLKSYKSKKVD